MDIEKMLKEITAAYNNFDYQSYPKARTYTFGVNLTF